VSLSLASSSICPKFCAKYNKFLDSNQGLSSKTLDPDPEPDRQRNLNAAFLSCRLVTFATALLHCAAPLSKDWLIHWFMVHLSVFVLRVRQTDGRTDGRAKHLIRLISTSSSPHHSSIPNSKLYYFSNLTLHRHLAPLRTDFTDTRAALRFFLCFSFFLVVLIFFRFSFFLSQVSYLSYNRLCLDFYFLLF